MSSCERRNVLNPSRSSLPAFLNPYSLDSIKSCQLLTCSFNELVISSNSTERQNQTVRDVHGVAPIAECHLLLLGRRQTRVMNPTRNRVPSSHTRRIAHSDAGVCVDYCYLDYCCDSSIPSLSLLSPNESAYHVTHIPT